MNDKVLRQEIIDELDYDPSVASAHIGVAVNQGVVTLSGHVPNYAQKRAAEQAARRVKGVRAIAEELKVDFGGAAPHGDEDIARRALTVLDTDVLVPAGKVAVKVQQGWVTLSGDVDWNYERTAAEDDVRKLRGVLGLTNLITIKPRVDVQDVERRIGQALKRSAEIEAKAITVTAKDGKVRLEGSVDSWSDRQALEHAVWSAPGVHAVEDHVHVRVF